MDKNIENKYQDIKELSDNFNSIQIELANKIEDYLIEILRNFNDDFIEFDSEQQKTTKYSVNGNVVTLTALQLDYYNSTYVELSFVDEYDNSFNEALCEMTTEQQISIFQDVMKYIEKYGYKNFNDM